MQIRRAASRRHLAMHRSGEVWHEGVVGSALVTATAEEAEERRCSA